MAQPILNWVGGKREELSLIRSCFPDDYEAYHELFFGAGAVFFDTAPHQQRSSINDINERLINLYQVVKAPDKYEKLIDTLKEIARDPNDSPDEKYRFAKADRDGDDISSYYYQQRELFNNRVFGEDVNQIEEAARMIYLNKTCFNAVYRENAKGEFNVPIGDGTANNWKLVEERIRAAHELLSNINIFQGDYREIVRPGKISNHIKPGDLVYFDPPYQGSYNQYHATQFDYEKQIELRDTAVELVDEGISVIISNSFDMASEYWYKDAFDIIPVGKRRLVNSDGSNRDQKLDIIVTSATVPEKIKFSPEQIEETPIKDILNSQRDAYSENITNAGTTD